MTTIVEYINPLLRGESLSFEQAESLLDVIFAGEVPEAQIAAFLTAMRAKGPT
ncbi:MAG: anthranilate phosphoribosyltransferase, partial [Planctomycetota bacterium]